MPNFAQRCSPILLSILLCVAGVVCKPLRAEPADDAYIAGYASAVLELEFSISSPAVQVKDGVITLREEDLAGIEREKVVEVLSRIDGVTSVQINEKTTTPAPAPGMTFFPSPHLFRHLESDPRWPHFSMAYQYYIHEKEAVQVGAVSLGETLALLQDDFPPGGQWQVGVQGAVFAIFDLASASHDLINADYFVSLPVSYRYQSFSALARVFHQSSHLGDEFLLRGETRHINLSYESVDLKLSYDMFGETTRIYCGAGYLFDQDPSSLKPVTTQVGLELKCPRTFFDGLVRPIAAVDLQNRQNSDWRTAVSFRCGAQFESPKLRKLNLQLLVEYYNGQSPNGQFFDRDIQYVGFGIHFFYE